MGANSKLMREADGLWSLWVCQVFAYKGMVMCGSCRNLLDWENADCGHFAKRRHMATRYMIENTAPLCRKCNTEAEADGEDEKHRAYIEEVYGEGTADMIIQKSHENCHMTKTDYQEIIDNTTHNLEKHGFKLKRERNI